MKLRIVDATRLSHLGDDLPPDELNRAERQGLHFGYPYCHGGYVLDPQYGKGRDCDNYTPPVQRLGPHVAGLLRKRNLSQVERE